jgi:hypothetical protein
VQRAAVTEQQFCELGLRLERRFEASLLLARARGGRFGDVWHARDAGALFRPMDQLAQARLSGESCASS